MYKKNKKRLGLAAFDVEVNRDSRDGDSYKVDHPEHREKLKHGLGGSSTHVNRGICDGP